MAGRKQKGMALAVVSLDFSIYFYIYFVPTSTIIYAMLFCAACVRFNCYLCDFDLCATCAKMELVKTDGRRDSGLGSTKKKMRSRLHSQQSKEVRFYCSTTRS